MKHSAKDPTATAPLARAAWTAISMSLCGNIGCSEDDPTTAVTGSVTSSATGSVTTVTGDMSASGSTSVGGGPGTTTASTASSVSATSTSGGDSVTASGSSSSASGGATTAASSTEATVSSTAATATMGAGGSSSTVNGAGATGAGGSTTSGEFQLSWVDEFDTVDTSRWEPMTHSWDGNLAQFSADTVAANNGILSLNLVEAPVGADKPYLGVEYRSRDTLTYGKVEARIQFARGSAVVSALVLIYTPWPPDDWNELDIEYLGTGRVQFNHMINIPPADPVSGHLQYPKIVELGFDPAADFHEYSVEWVPGEARFLVDGELRHTATEEMSRMVLPQNILLTIWASDAPDWAGPVDATTAPTMAHYDWIRVYDYVGQ